MMIRLRYLLMLHKLVSASAPDTLLTANQPTPAMTALMPAGSELPQYPNEIRDSTICGTPYSGPRADNAPIVTEPSTVPRTIAPTAWPKVRPNASIARKPTNTVANSKFG